MRYKELITERRRQKTVTYYHGTIGDFVPSILKHGLIPNPKFRNYADGEYRTFSDGIYLARSAPSVKQHIKNIKNSHEEFKDSDSILIEVQVVKKSFTIDEDEVMAKIDSIIGDISNDIYHYKEDIVVDMAEYISQIIPTMVARNVNGNKYLIKAYVNMVEFIVMAILFDLESESDYHNFDEVLRMVDSALLVSMFRDDYEFEKLMNSIFKYSTGRVSSDESTIRVERPIGFRGKTRITKNTNLTTGEIIY